MRRFYCIDVQPTLFGDFAVVRRWGRIGRQGQQLERWFRTEAEAHREARRWAKVKTRRGYRVDV